MNNDNSRQNYGDENEIDLRQLFKSLKERSRFIVGFTGIVTLIAIGYVLSLTAPPAQYNVETAFLKPTESSVIKLNQSYVLEETANSIFTKLLTTLNSKLLQKEVFIDGGYAEKLGKESKSIVNDDSYIAGFISSIEINNAINTMEFELPHTLSIQGLNPDILSEFIDEVLATADKVTINSFINIKKLKIENRLNEITIERQLLLIEAKADRMSQIKRIKEEDAQKLREINDKIEGTRLKAKTQRINQIVILTHAAQLAATLGITKNNLNQFSKDSSQTNFNVAMQSGTNIPDWYLYGETALLEMIALLQNRVDDDPFIVELAKLNNQVNEIQNNTLLQTLEQRLDDSPFTAKINQLDIETIQLKSISPDPSGINAMQLYQAATSQIIPTKNKNRLIIAVAFIGSFMFSIFLVLLMNSFKEEDVTSIQKGK